MNQNISRRDELLLEAVRSAEETALKLRSYAAAVIWLPNECTYESEAPLPVHVEITPEDWVLAALPVILPQRTDGDRSRFLASYLWSAVRAHFKDKPLPKFHSCVLIYEHIYAFLTNDTASLCSAFQCSHFGKTEGTHIWIVPAEQFPFWLEKHKICWSDTPKN